MLKNVIKFSDDPLLNIKSMSHISIKSDQNMRYLSPHLAQQLPSPAYHPAILRQPISYQLTPQKWSRNSSWYCLTSVVKTSRPPTHSTSHSFPAASQLQWAALLLSVVLFPFRFLVPFLHIRTPLQDGRLSRLGR
jgi:hypothetical protein